MNEKRYKILKEAIELVPFDGWSNATLQQATKQARLPVHYEQIAFPGGVIDAVELYLQQISDKTYDVIDKQQLKSMKIRERIYHILNTRLEIMAENKAGARKTLQFLAMPQNLFKSTQLLWQMADKAWYAAGDTATDFNHYTKRTILMGVYSGSLLFWLNDESKNHQETQEFLRRRIENVMQIGKVKEKLMCFGNKK